MRSIGPRRSLPAPEFGCPTRPVPPDNDRHGPSCWLSDLSDSPNGGRRSTMSKEGWEGHVNGRWSRTRPPQRRLPGRTGGAVVVVETESALHRRPRARPMIDRALRPHWRHPSPSSSIACCRFRTRVRPAAVLARQGTAREVAWQSTRMAIGDPNRAAARPARLRIGEQRKHHPERRPGSDPRVPRMASNNSCGVSHVRPSSSPRRRP